MGLGKSRCESHQGKRGETAAALTKRVPVMAPGKVGIRHQMLTTLMMDKLWAEGEGLHAARMVKTISTHLLVIHHLLSSNKYLSGTPTVCQAPGIEVIDV